MWSVRPVVSTVTITNETLVTDTEIYFEKDANLEDDTSPAIAATILEESEEEDDSVIEDGRSGVVFPSWSDASLPVFGSSNLVSKMPCQFEGDFLSARSVVSGRSMTIDTTNSKMKRLKFVPRAAQTINDLTNVRIAPFLLKFVPITLKEHDIGDIYGSDAFVRGEKGGVLIEL